MSSSQYTKSDWCYQCVGRTGLRRFRELSAYGICSACEAFLKKTNPLLLTQLTQCTPNLLPVVESRRTHNPCTKSAESIKKYAQRQLLFEQQEIELIAVFNQIQQENKGIWWRKDAASRLGWSDSLLKEVIKRVRRHKELKPTPMTEVVLKFVTEDYQSARQILTKLPSAKVDWVHISLERLAKEGRITRLYNKPYETKYKLLKTTD